MQIGKHMGLTSVQVHDYYYNNWQMQFFDSADFGKEELRLLFLLNHNASLSIGDNIEAASKLFKEKYPDKRFCDRKLYSMLYYHAKRCDSELELKRPIYKCFTFAKIYELTK